jgi:hypothetical protein
VRFEGLGFRSDNASEPPRCFEFTGTVLEIGSVPSDDRAILISVDHPIDLDRLPAK